MAEEKIIGDGLLPEEQTGQKEEGRQEMETPDSKTKKGKTGNTQERKIPKILEPYIKAYPKERTFHVTTDKQVFLEKDLNLARLHQRSLKNGEKIQTIKVK
mgnify:CR=1 FL=1|nr:hypothetical protein [Odoribacter splanchnicus]